MSIEPSSLSTADVLTAPTAAQSVLPVSSTFDDRWTAWQAKGVAHDLAVRRKLTIAVPIVVIVAAAIFYAL